MHGLNTQFDVNNVPAIIKEILEKRGIYESDYEEYFNHRPRLTYDPFLLANMREGVDLLLEAVDNHNKIFIYGDYDVDGVTATSILYKVLKSLNADVNYYIPSRLDEGYGLSVAAIDKIKSFGAEFIVTVDCGSVSYDEVKYANSLGIKTLVTDHHSISSVIAPGLVINPNLPYDEYPFKGLSGAGVAYKLALAIAKIREVSSSVMTEIIELAALGTIADIMPLVSENRTLVKVGFRMMRLGCKNPGLRALVDLGEIDYKNISVQDISFGIAPRINACGRIGDASLAVELFLATDPARIQEIAKEMTALNERRREFQDNAIQIALESIQDAKTSDFPLIMISGGHEGVLGIVAGKVREMINRPVIILTESQDHIKGTGRSIPGVNLFEVLDKRRELFISMGGHSGACGFTIDVSNIESLREHLLAEINNLHELNSNLFDEKYIVDADISINDINFEFVKFLDYLEPCGKENEIPLFRIKNLRLLNWTFLKEDKHIARFDVSQDGKKLQCILFHDAEKYYDLVNDALNFDAIGKLIINSFNGEDRLQLNIVTLICEGNYAE